MKFPVIPAACLFSLAASPESDSRSWLWIPGLRQKAAHPGMTAVSSYDSRRSNSRRPSGLSSFRTAPDAAISPWLA